MNIAISDIKKDMKAHLAIIGKRLYDKEGKNLFSNVTLSTAEEPVIEQYISTAAQNIEALLQHFITGFSVTQKNVTISIHNTRGASDFSQRCEEMVKSYITIYVVAEYLAMTHPEMAEKYRQDAGNALLSLQLYVFHKQAPTEPTKSYEDIKGEIK